MSKFNRPVSTTSKTDNLAGGESFVMTPELELVSALLTTFLEDKFYESGENRHKRIVKLVKEVDPLFAAKASLFARREFGMRSVSHVVAASLEAKGQEWTKRYYDQIVYRPDDMMEILSVVEANGQKITNPMRKGFASALCRFDEYQLAKYRAADKKNSLVDVVNMVHPKGSDAVGKLVRDELRNKDTFEAKLSKAGQDGGEEAKSKAWAELIMSGKIGYMALLKNLRNVIDSADPEVTERAVRLLKSRSRIEKSLVLPFRFMKAYGELSNLHNSSRVLSGVSDALDISFANVPKFEGETLVVVDHSGSMGTGANSAFGKGALFGIALAKSSDADFMHFGDTAKYLSFNKNDSTLTLFGWLDSLNSGWDFSRVANDNSYVGHGTNFNAIFESANKKYDRIIIISDMQAWVGYNNPSRALGAYKNKYEANPQVYSWDMTGYGTLEFPENRVATLAGWSEKIFDIMQLVETDKNALVKKINSIEV